MINSKGQVTIIKKYSDREEIEVGNNILTLGFGINLSNLFSRTTGKQDNHLPIYFQLGTDVNTIPVNPASSSFFSLSESLAASGYGKDTSIGLLQANRSFYVDSGSEVKFNLINLSSTLSATKEIFGVVASITSIFQNGFEVNIKLDKKIANGVIIREVGLFAKNPYYLANISPLLIAYKEVNIEKNSDLEVDIHWRISLAESDLISF